MLFISIFNLTNTDNILYCLLRLRMSLKTLFYCSFTTFNLKRETYKLTMGDVDRSVPRAIT